MKCTHCGAENMDGDSFCVQCGTPLSPSVASAENNAPKSSPSDTEYTPTTCPHCSASNCTPLAKNLTEIHHSGYSAGSGCCGLFLLGPFGLLCGLCGRGTDTNISSETWWVCPQCGKQHIDKDDAMNKGSKMIKSAILYSLFIGTLLCFIQPWFGPSIICAIATVVFTFCEWSSIYKSISSELGRSVIDLMTPKQLLSCLIWFLVSIAFSVALSFNADVLISSLLGE